MWHDAHGAVTHPFGRHLPMNSIPHARCLVAKVSCKVRETLRPSPGGDDLFISESTLPCG